MPEVELIREGRTIQVEKGANLRQALLDQGVEVYRAADVALNCRGNGLCGTCMVEVRPPEAANAVTFREKAKLWQFGERPIRFSCRTTVEGDCKVLTTPQYTHGWLEHPYYAYMKESVDEGVRDDYPA